MKNKELAKEVPIIEKFDGGCSQVRSLDSDEQILTDEWSGLEPTKKKMGLVQLTLDKGVKTTVVGTIYGLDFEIETDDYFVKLFFDYYNKRLKVLDYTAKNYHLLIKKLAYLAEANDFDKIFVKAIPNDFQQWLSHGYMMEGILKYFFEGKDAYVLSYFRTDKRIQSKNLMAEAKLIEELLYNTKPKKIRPLDPKLEIRLGTKENISDLITIYRSVFDTYPSPLTNPDYIKSTMDRNVIFRLAYLDDVAIAAASAEIDFKNSNAELTDCATTPEAQGKGVMQHLLIQLENDLREKKIKTGYTMARAMSFGMNCSFMRLGYEFSGRLINNCDIFGQFEDINIWVKKL
ncbi:MAG: putative beta-lysine N-acetyltransferase [Candidatus Cloacimonetes bacterium]|nr:putative beta-lysine N-acetyltransferase [Candidatus Cloacimonadota bacterium]